MPRSVLLNSGLPFSKLSILIAGKNLPRSRSSIFSSSPSSINFNQKRALQNQTINDADVTYGKRMKDDFKRKRIEKRNAKTSSEAERSARLANWDLTVGLEIHVQLNTENKLFSASKTSIDDAPNSNISFFDLAFPGSQPIFQTATLIPALRAAIALDCRIEQKSRFDRKHYFYPDQPAGYQITQYYQPFARDGKIRLHRHDMMWKTDKVIEIGIKQVQLEQDTAKSMSHRPSTTLVDFNRVGHPLIEIITLPEITSPWMAAGCARKIQSVLQSVNAVFTGMEMGGLRVDVNVSVSPKGSTRLGQRTEIKNLSSFKAIEQAIVAERDRQVEILEDGEIVAGETRGWTIGDMFTTKLRGKEGEVDYRYMPDPDILPLSIDGPVIDHIRDTLPPLPDKIISDLHNEFGLSTQNAKTLVTLDYGQRVEYYDVVCSHILNKLDGVKDGDAQSSHTSRVVANWVTHELGGLISTSARPFSPDDVPAKSMADIIKYLLAGRITGTSAKRLLSMVFNGDKRDIDSIIEEEDMAAQDLSDAEYEEMARNLVDEHPQKVAQIRKGQIGKLKFLVGQMMRIRGGNVDAIKAENALKAVLNL